MASRKLPLIREPDLRITSKEKHMCLPDCCFMSRSVVCKCIWLICVRLAYYYSHVWKYLEMNYIS